MHVDHNAEILYIKLFFKKIKREGIFDKSKDRYFSSLNSFKLVETRILKYDFQIEFMAHIHNFIKYRDISQD